MCAVCSTTVTVGLRIWVWWGWAWYALETGAPASPCNPCLCGGNGVVLAAMGPTRMAEQGAKICSHRVTPEVHCHITLFLCVESV